MSPYIGLKLNFLAHLVLHEEGLLQWESLNDFYSLSFDDVIGGCKVGLRLDQFGFEAGDVLVSRLELALDRIHRLSYQQYLQQTENKIFTQNLQQKTQLLKKDSKLNRWKLPAIDSTILGSV